MSSPTEADEELPIVYANAKIIHNEEDPESQAAVQAEPEPAEVTEAAPTTEPEPTTEAAEETQDAAAATEEPANNAQSSPEVPEVVAEALLVQQDSLASETPLATISPIEHNNNDEALTHAVMSSMQQQQQSSAIEMVDFDDDNELLDGYFDPEHLQRRKRARNTHCILFGGICIVVFLSILLTLLESAPWQDSNQSGDIVPDVLTPSPTASPFDYTYLFDADEAVPFWNATMTEMYRGMWDEVWCEQNCRGEGRPMVGYVYIFVGDVYDVTNCVCYYDAMPTCLQRQPQILDQPSVMRSNEPIPNVTCS